MPLFEVNLVQRAEFELFEIGIQNLQSYPQFLSAGLTAVKANAPLNRLESHQGEQNAILKSP